MTIWRLYPSEYDPDRAVDLAGYTGSLAAYAGATAATFLACRVTGARPPERYAPLDLVIGAVATHKATRLLGKASVTSPVRAPFTVFTGPAGSAEHHEEPRGEPGFRHTVGELVTCPFCLGVWLGSAYVAGLVLAPRPTRTIAALLSVVAGSDALQHVYQRLRQD